MAPIDAKGAEGRRDYILNRARELAQSGRYPDYRAIGWELSEGGYPDARQVLGSQEVRVELDRACRRAQEDQRQRVRSDSQD